MQQEAHFAYASGANSFVNVLMGGNQHITFLGTVLRSVSLQLFKYHDRLGWQGMSERHLLLALVKKKDGYDKICIRKHENSTTKREIFS